jgi:hypothetical protein
MSMNTPVHAFGALGAALVLSVEVGANPQSPGSSITQPCIVVELNPGAQIGNVTAVTGTTVRDSIPGSRYYLLEAPPLTSTNDLQLLVAVIQQSPHARFAELDQRTWIPETSYCGIQGEASTQGCTTVGVLTGIAGAREFRSQDWLERIGARAAQNLPAPTECIVAVIDSGVDLTHPDLVGALYSDGYDFVHHVPGAWDTANLVDDDHDGLVDEGFGHGTHVAGTILLVAPRARILPLKVVDDEGNGWGFDIAKAVWYASNSGARVINLSLGLNKSSQVLTDALSRALAQGISVFASAGNTARAQVQFPGNMSNDASSVFTVPPIYPHGVVCVTAVDDADRLAYFAAWGALVDVSAPGTSICSTYPGGRYAWWSGTSMSCAIASGACALVRTVVPSGAGTPPAEGVVASAFPIDAWNPGHAGQLGHGRVDVMAAILSLQH